eukprot:9961614-Heterocapsa_arctica.AAC.1
MEGQRKEGFQEGYMLYHQQKTDYNTREYQKKRLDIRNIYTELEEIGWNRWCQTKIWKMGES